MEYYDMHGDRIKPGDLIRRTDIRSLSCWEHMVSIISGVLCIHAGVGSQTPYMPLHELDLSVLAICGHVAWYDDFIATH